MTRLTPSAARRRLEASMTATLLRDTVDQFEQSTDVRQRLRLTQELTGLVESLTTEATSDAINAGHSWADIAEWLGMSKSGAHRKFANAKTQ